MHTHDTTCAPEVAASGAQKWADFTQWVKTRSAENAKPRPSRQFSLFAEPASWELGGTRARSGVGAIDAPARSGARTGAALATSPVRAGAPLVNRCISQHTRKIPVLGVKFEVYPRSVRVVRPCSLPAGATRGGQRSTIDGFSEGSRRRLRRVASEAGEGLVSQFGLTYHETQPTGDEVKRHLNAWLTWLRRRVDGIKYLWVLEFQRRGAPHFHVFLSEECGQDALLQMHMAQKWNQITGETLDHLSFHLHAKNFVTWDMGNGAYACKYLEKEYQKCVPDGFGWVGRFWGSSRSLMPKPCVYDVHEIRAMAGQNVQNARVSVPRETHGRDMTHILLRALGNFQESRRRRWGYRGRHLSQVRNSRWVQDGASVLWRVIEHRLSGSDGRTSTFSDWASGSP